MKIKDIAWAVKDIEGLISYGNQIPVFFTRKMAQQVKKDNFSKGKIIKVKITEITNQRG